jgi:multidrug efflux pump subunit AcrB
VLNTVITGTPITQVRDDIYLVDVVVRATDEQRASLATLRTLQVPLPSGRTVAHSQFATFEYVQDYPLVWRRDRVPTLTVQADVRPGTLPETVTSALSSAVDELAKSLPRSYQIAARRHGRGEARSRKRPSLVVPVMLLIMLTVLMVQLRSPTPVPGAQRRPARADRRRRSCCWSRKPLGFVAILGIGPARHDHQECRDPDRSD